MYPGEGLAPHQSILGQRVCLFEYSIISVDTKKSIRLMIENSLINHLKKVILIVVHLFRKSIIGGENLVSFLNDLLYIAASIELGDNDKFHPLITMNCIKNIIGDNRASPSESLLIIWIASMQR